MALPSRGKPIEFNGFTRFTIRECVAIFRESRGESSSFARPSGNEDNLRPETTLEKLNNFFHMPGNFQCAAEAIIEKDGLILIAQRALNLDNAPGKWETITGRVEQGESFEQAVKREVKEETGLDVEVVKPYDTFHFYRGSEKIEHLGVSFWCKYVSGEVKLDEKEQIDYKWLSPDQAIEIIENENIKESIRKFKKCLETQ